MTLETKGDLSEETIEALQDLIQATIDSADGFSDAAAQLQDLTLISLFVAMGKQRRELSTKLQTHVQRSGERPATEGSWRASLHRIWLDLRATLNSGDVTVVLCEVERGEGYIKQAYEDVLKRTAGNPLNDVLLQQYASVKQGHDRIQEIRDHYQAASQG